MIKAKELKLYIEDTAEFKEKITGSVAIISSRLSIVNGSIVLKIG